MRGDGLTRRSGEQIDAHSRQESALHCMRETRARGRDGDVSGVGVLFIRRAVHDDGGHHPIEPGSLRVLSMAPSQQQMSR
jgi:hypothetical protein